MRKHPEIGYRIAQSTRELCHISDYILCHHERWDGKGYPKALSGEEIPKLSRVIAIVDSFDAMTSIRSYKKAIPLEDALAEIEKCSGSQFDPELAYSFVKMMRKHSF